MPSVILPTHAGPRKPPPGVQINWSHPLARGLSLCYVLDEGGGGIADSLITPNDRLALTGGSASGWKDIRERGYYSNNSSHAGGLNTSPSAIATSPSKAFTLFWRGIFTAASQTDWVRVFGVSYNTADANPPCAYALSYDNAASKFVVDFNDAGFTVQSSVTGWLKSGELHSYAASANSTATTAYRDGVLVNTDTTNDISGQINYTASSQILLGRDLNTSTVVPNCHSVAAYAWNRVLTPGEHQQLAANPYCFLIVQSPTDRFWLTIAGGGTNFPVSMSGGLTPSGALGKRPAKQLAGTATPSGTLSKRSGRALAGTLTSAGALVRRPGKALAGSLSPSGTLAASRTRLIVLAGALSPSGTLARQTTKRLAGTLASAGGLTRRPGKALAGTLTSAGSLTRRPAKTLSGAVSPTGTLAAIRTRLLSLAGSLAPSGSLSKQTHKQLAGGLTPSGGLVKRIGRQLAGALSPSGALSAIRNAGNFTVNLAGSLAPSGALQRSVRSGLAGALTPSGALVKATARRLNGALAPSGVLVKARTAHITLSGAVASAGNLSRRVGLNLAGALSPAGGLSKRIGKVLSGVLGIAGSLVKVLHGQEEPGTVTLTLAVRDSAELALATRDGAALDLTERDTVTLDLKEG